MTSNAVSVGVVGTSWWADAMHLPALASHPAANTVAICGRNRSNARRMADAWGIPQVFTDYREMIERADLDAIVISTPNSTHYPIAMKALDASLHVLCEKPIALTYAQAREMAETSQARGLKTLAPFTYSFMPTARYLKELIDGGYLGNPYHLNMRYYTGFAREGDYRWRFDKRIAGAGVIGDLGSHFLYLAEWFFGDIEALTCRLGHTVPRPPVEEPVVEFPHLPSRGLFRAGIVREVDRNQVAPPTVVCRPHVREPRVIERGEVDGRSPQPVVPPHRHRVPFDQLEKALQHGLLQHVPGGAAIGADRAIPRPVRGSVPAGEQEQIGRQQLVAPLGQRPQRRPVHPRVGVEGLGYELAIDSGEISRMPFTVLALAEVHHVVRVNGVGSELAQRAGDGHVRFLPRARVAFDRLAERARLAWMAVMPLPPAQ